MKRNFTRRDVVTAAGGTAVGLLMSPLPWKLVDDLAIWTQNWPWVPTPPEGKITSAVTICALCPAGCPLRVRSVGATPVSLAPAHGDASGRGPCPVGLTGHHLAFHPARLVHAVRMVGGSDGARALPVQFEAVVAALASAKRRGGVAVLDQRPGRSVSWAWRRMLAALPGGAYVPGPNREDHAATTLQAMLASPWGPVGFDLGHAATVVSFGAPLLELGGVSAAGVRPATLVQVEARLSPAARAADSWLPAAPGSEGVLALAIANVLVAEGLVALDAVRAQTTDLDAYLDLVARFTPAFAAAVTGVPGERISATARDLAAHRPSVVLPGSDPAGGPFPFTVEAAIWGLNVLLGSLGTRGGVVRRTMVPPPRGDSDGPVAAEVELDAIPDRSLGVLIVDAAAGDPLVPWHRVARTIARGGTVVALSPYLAGTAVHADYVVPTPACLEGFAEVPTAGFAAAATFAVSAPLIGPPRGALDPMTFLRAAEAALGVAAHGSWTSTVDAIRARAEGVYLSRRGELVPPNGEAAAPIAGMASPDAFWSALQAGARWRDLRTEDGPVPLVSLLGGPRRDLEQLADGGARGGAGEHARPLLLVPAASADAAASAVVSPLLGKLYRESGLRRTEGTAAINPITGGALGLESGRRARLSTANAVAKVTVVFDSAVAPGVVEVTVAPGACSLGERPPARGESLLELCGADAGPSWRSTPARLEGA
jgi:anaerobic selenocysteine-containing dehydrogenase